MIKILFFGKLAELAIKEIGSSQFNMESNVNTLTLSNVIAEIANRSNTLSEQVSATENLIAINQVMQSKSDIKFKLKGINSGDEVAFMSPLSGG